MNAKVLMPVRMEQPRELAGEYAPGDILTGRKAELALAYEASLELPAPVYFAATEEEEAKPEE